MTDENPAPVDELERTQDEAQVAQPAPEPKLPARRPLRAGAHPMALVPQTYEECWRISQHYVATGMAPRDMKTAERVQLVLMAGLEVGLPPVAALNNIAIINNKPRIWGAAVPALAMNSGQLVAWDEKIEGEGEQMVARCLIARRVTPDLVIRREETFSVADAKRAGLWQTEEMVERLIWEGGNRVKRTVKNDSPWYRYQKRMLKMRARVAFTDLFSDVYCGLGIAEVYVGPDADAEMRDITPSQEHERIDNPLGGDDEAEQGRVVSHEEGARMIQNPEPDDGAVVHRDGSVMREKPADAPKAPAATKPPAARKNAPRAAASPAQTKRPDDIILGKPPRSTGADYLSYVQTWVAVAEAFEEEGFLAGTYIRDRYAKEAGLRNNLGVPLTEEERSAVQSVCKASVERIKARSNETAQPQG